MEFNNMNKIDYTWEEIDAACEKYKDRFGEIFTLRGVNPNNVPIMVERCLDENKTNTELYPNTFAPPPPTEI